MKNLTAPGPHQVRPIAQTNIGNQVIKTYNIQDSNVNIYNTFPPNQGNPYSAAQMIALNNFSKEYYQLLVTCETDVFENNNATFPLDRVLSQRYVPEEILTRCSSLSEEGIAELKTFPAIVCMENTGFNGITDPNQTAIFAYITRVKMEGYQVRVAFQPIAPFHQKILCEQKYAIYFDLNMSCAITDLNRTAWSIHKVNLFEAFNESGLGYLPHPSI